MAGRDYEELSADTELGQRRLNGFIMRGLAVGLSVAERPLGGPVRSR